MYSSVFVLLSLLSTVRASDSSSQIPLDGCIGDVCGCGKRTDYTGLTYEQTVESSGGTRDFLIHVPMYYDPDALTGLIFAYHGRYQDAYSQEVISELSDWNYNWDHIVVYPQGVNDSWQGAPYAVPGVDDLKFTHDILHHMRQNFCIDNSRIYATGKSNGGGFVGTLACNIVGQNFAAFAPVSGAFYTDVDCSSSCAIHSQPRPVIEFHGDADDTIPYDSDVPHKKGPLPTIPHWLQCWAGRNGCQGSPPANQTDSEYDGEVSHSSWSCGGHENVVQGYLVHGLGHTWPSTHWNLDNKGGHCPNRTSSAELNCV